MSERLVTQVLNRMGLDSPTWRTLVILSSATTHSDPTQVWSRWAAIENWSSVSPLVSAAQWVSGDPWRPGSELTEQLSLGFPRRHHNATMRVISVDPGRSAEWGDANSKVRTAHLWRFEPRTDGGTDITTVAVLQGASIGLWKQIVAKRWHRLFQAHLDTVVEMAASPRTNTADHTASVSDNNDRVSKGNQ